MRSSHGRMDGVWPLKLNRFLDENSTTRRPAVKVVAAVMMCIEAKLSVQSLPNGDAKSELRGLELAYSRRHGT